MALDPLPAVGYRAGPKYARARSTKGDQGRVTGWDLVDRSLVPDDPGQLQVDQVRRVASSVESGSAPDRVAEVSHGHSRLPPLRVPNVVDLQLYMAPGVAHAPMVADIAHGLNRGGRDTADDLPAEPGPGPGLADLDRQTLQAACDRWVVDAVTAGTCPGPATAASRGGGRPCFCTAP